MRRSPASRPAELVPQCLFGGRLRGRRFEVEQALPGEPAAAAIARGLPVEPFLADTFAAIAPLHRHGAVSEEVDDELLHELVDRPVAVLEGRTPARSRPALAALRDELRRSLAGRRVAVGTVHGDLWPGNVLLGTRGEVTGIVDWESSSARGIAAVDRTHLLLTSRALAGDAELGEVVADALRRPRPVSERDPGALSLRTQVLLAWLLHVTNNTTKSDRYRRNPVWRRANVQPVLDVVACHASAAGRLPVDAGGRAWALPAWSGLAVGALGLAGWLASLSAVRPAGMGDLGLASVLPASAFAGLAAIAAGIALAVARGRRRHGAWAASPGSPRSCTRTAPLIYESLRYSWAYKHVGIVDFIQRTGHVDRGTDVLPVYHQWPGFFGADALATSLAGLPGALGPGHVGATRVRRCSTSARSCSRSRAFTSDRARIVASRPRCSSSAGWVGQEYFSPQAFAFFLCCSAHARLRSAPAAAGAGARARRRHRGRPPAHRR